MEVEEILSLPNSREWKCVKHGGPHSTMDSILALPPAAPGSILGVPKIFSDKILDVVEI